MSTKLTAAEIAKRMAHHPPTQPAVSYHEFIREVITATTESLNNKLPPCRETERALTKLEEALFWANAAIARNHDRL